SAHLGHRDRRRPPGHRAQRGRRGGDRAGARRCAVDTFPSIAMMAKRLSLVARASLIRSHSRQASMTISLLRIGTAATALLLLEAAAIPELALAGDWPQILGPSRNGVARDERIVDRLPAGGPPVLWEYAVGEGFAGVAVSH